MAVKRAERGAFCKTALPDKTYSDHQQAANRRIQPRVAVQLGDEFSRVRCGVLVTDGALKPLHCNSEALRIMEVPPDSRSVV